jgi:hypothetical protein
MIWFYFATISSILTVFLWLRDEWKIIKNANKYYRILYPVVFIVLAIIAIGQYQKIDEMSKLENEAAIISKNWPSIDNLKFMSKGEQLGIIMAGQTFLEKHKEKFPDTYETFNN